MPRSYPTLQCHGCGCTFQPANGNKAQKNCSKSCAARHRAPGSARATTTSFKPKQVPWNKGLNGYLAGRKQTSETKAKIAASVTGERSPNWKGGISPENERIRKTAAYREWREAVFARDQWTCQECGAKSVTGHRLRIHADHIKPFALYPGLRLEVSNGRTLCESCHRRTPTYGCGSFTGETASLERVEAMAAD